MAIATDTAFVETARSAACEYCTGISNEHNVRHRVECSLFLFITFDEDRIMVH